MSRARKKHADPQVGGATPITPVIEELARKYDLVPASEIPDPSLPSFEEKRKGRSDLEAVRKPPQDREQERQPPEAVPEELPPFPIKMREPFPPLPQGFEARGTFEAAGIRVNRHGDGATATQFKDGHAMSFEEKLAFEGKGNRYIPRDKQWANPESSWEQKLSDAREMAEARLKDRER